MTLPWQVWTSVLPVMVIPPKPRHFNRHSARVESCLEAVMLPCWTPNPLPPIMKIENEFRLVLEHNVRPLCNSPPLTESTPHPPCLAMAGILWQHNVRTTSTRLDKMWTVSYCLDSDPNSLGMEQLLLQLSCVPGSVSQGICD